MLFSAGFENKIKSNIGKKVHLYLLYSSFKTQTELPFAMKIVGLGKYILNG